MKKKLELRKEIIAELSNRQMDEVLGGVGEFISENPEKCEYLTGEPRCLIVPKSDYCGGNGNGVTAGGGGGDDDGPKTSVLF